MNEQLAKHFKINQEKFDFALKQICGYFKIEKHELIEALVDADREEFGLSSSVLECLLAYSCQKAFEDVLFSDAVKLVVDVFMSEKRFDQIRCSSLFSKEFLAKALDFGLVIQESDLFENQMKTTIEYCLQHKEVSALLADVWSKTEGHYEFFKMILKYGKITANANNQAVS